MDINDLTEGQINEMIYTPAANKGNSSKINENYPPSTEIHKYTDRGPFYLIAERNKIDHIDLELTLKRIPNIDLINIVKISQNKVRIQAKNYHAANKLIAHKSLYNINDYKIYLPKNYVITSGFIQNIPTKFTNDEIKNNITSNYEFDDVERLTKWDPIEHKSIPTESIKINFRANNVPDRIHIAYCPVKVHLCVQRPLFCKNTYHQNAKFYNNYAATAQNQTTKNNLKNVIQSVNSAKKYHLSTATTGLCHTSVRPTNTNTKS